MIWCLPVFIAAFIQGYVATVEVYFISQVKPLKAAWWDLLNGAIQWGVIVLIIVNEQRVPILIADVLGSALATFVSLKRVRK